MKIKQSFVISALLHIFLLGGLVAFGDFKSQKIEEVTIELSMFNEMIEEQEVQQQPQPVVQKVVQPTPKPTPVVKKVEPIVAKEPVVSEVSENIAEAVVEAPVVSEPVVAIAETPPPPQAKKVDVEKEFVDANFALIASILKQNTKYPKAAKRLKHEGNLKVAFKLCHNGSVENIKIVSSSGFDTLDRAAIDLVERSARSFPRPPRSVNITVPLNYSLV